MSLYDYRKSLLLMESDPPFYALIMAAMRQADTDNQGLLQLAFPDVWQELQQRRHRVGGRLPGEPGPHGMTVE